MTTRQSNIIFYSIISLIISAIIIHYIVPDLFSDFSKSKEELTIQAAIDSKEYERALSLYQLKEKGINTSNENSADVATMYKEIAQLHEVLANKKKEKEYLLKYLSIHEKLKKTDTLSNIIKIYDRLGLLEENEEQYDEAQFFYEKSLSIKLGTSEEKDDGLFMGMQNSRERYLRLNNEQTITTLKKLGEIHTIKREYLTAKKYYERALNASKLTFGEDDSKTVEIMKLMNQIVL